MPGQFSGALTSPQSNTRPAREDFPQSKIAAMSSNDMAEKSDARSPGGAARLAEQACYKARVKALVPNVKLGGHSVLIKS
jgi:hypothetical protein